jgi:S1-C subfamily serine protease
MFTESRGWLFSLARSRWMQCVVNQNGGLLLIENIIDGEIIPGMSGTPIVSDQGAAIGIVSERAGEEASRNPRLVGNLPGWALRELGLWPAS